MQIMRFKRATGVALGITDAPGKFEDVPQSFREAKKALLEWKNQNGAACEMVMFTYVANPELHDQIADFLRKIRSEEQDLAPLLQSVAVQVSLLNKQGKPVQEFKIPAIQGRGADGPKPWWK